MRPKKSLEDPQKQRILSCADSLRHLWKIEYYTEGSGPENTSFGRFYLHENVWRVCKTQMFCD